MLFEKTHIGKPISPELSKYLRDWLSIEDKALVSEKTNLSLSTIRDLLYRNTRLTKENSITVIELMKIAVVNCTNRIEYGKRVKKELEASL